MGELRKDEGGELATTQKYTCDQYQATRKKQM